MKRLSRVFVGVLLLSTACGSEEEAPGNGGTGAVEESITGGQEPAPTTPPAPKPLSTLSGTYRGLATLEGAAYGCGDSVSGGQMTVVATATDAGEFSLRIGDAVSTGDISTDGWFQTYFSNEVSSDTFIYQFFDGQIEDGVMHLSEYDTGYFGGVPCWVVFHAVLSR